ncbi:MAG: hypothetical protein CMD43_00525 [Gammaproteobacteria bacterium]|nr:hypothetical protein [Gammaproteobacteria bacterium]
MSNIKIYIILFLIFANVILSFGVVWLEHITRSQFREIQFLSNQKYDLEIELKKSRVEKRKYDSLSKIEKFAQSKLKMFTPKERVLININE